MNAPTRISRHSWRRVGSTDAPYRLAAEEWLLPILSRGPVAATVIVAQATASGIAARTAYRALHALGGRTRRRGYGGPYFWELRPQAAAQAEDAH